MSNIPNKTSASFSGNEMQQSKHCSSSNIHNAIGTRIIKSNDSVTNQKSDLLILASSLSSSAAAHQFEEAFAPLAHHLFPDGLIELEPVSSSESSLSINSSYRHCWPRRTDRRIVSAEEALNSISKVRKFAEKFGLSSSQLHCVTKAACQTLPPPLEITTSSFNRCDGDTTADELSRRTKRRRFLCNKDDNKNTDSASSSDCDDEYDDEHHQLKNINDNDTVGGNTSSTVSPRCQAVDARGTKLVDGTSKCFVNLIRCLVPASSQPLLSTNTATTSSLIMPGDATTSDTDNNQETTNGTDPSVIIPSNVISLLLAVSSPFSKRCDVNGRIAVLRFLTLVVRNGCLLTTGKLLPTPPTVKDAPSLALKQQHQLDPRATLSNLYSIPFAMITSSTSTIITTNNAELSLIPDAIRLLHAITRQKHATQYRARRLRVVYDQLWSGVLSQGQQQQDQHQCYKGNIAKTKKMLVTFVEPIRLLLQLYARYNPQGCGMYYSRMNCRDGRGRTGKNGGVDMLTRCFTFPDESWQNDFERVYTTQKSYAISSTERTISGDDHCDSNNKISRNNKSKTMARFSSNLYETLGRLENAFDGVRSASWELILSPKQSKHKELKARATNHVCASDLLSDDSLVHLILLSHQTRLISTSISDEKNVSQTELVCLRTCLPHMIHKEWYGITPCNVPIAGTTTNKQNGIDVSRNSILDNTSYNSIDVNAQNNSNNKFISKRAGLQLCDRTMKYSLRDNDRERLMRTLAFFANKVGFLIPGLETFLLNDTLPFWDGADGFISETLRSDLLSVVSPMISFQEFRKRVLVHLAGLYVPGLVRIKYLIVSGALSSIVRRWGRLLAYGNAVNLSSKDIDPLTSSSGEKCRILYKVIEWTDNLLLTGLIAENGDIGMGRGGEDGGGNQDLVRLSALDFFEAVGSVAQSCHGKTNFVACPSPALMYRLLLSNTAVSIDRVCNLLLLFKGIFQRIRSKSLSSSDVMDTENQMNDASGSRTEDLYGLEK